MYREICGVLLSYTGALLFTVELQGCLGSVVCNKNQVKNSENMLMYFMQHS